MNKKPNTREELFQLLASNPERTPLTDTQSTVEAGSDTDTLIQYEDLLGTVPFLASGYGKETRITHRHPGVH